VGYKPGDRVGSACRPAEALEGDIAVAAPRKSFSFRLGPLAHLSQAWKGGGELRISYAVPFPDLGLLAEYWL
jgi:hypothetical protein